MIRRNEEKWNWANNNWHNMDRNAQTIHHQSLSTQASSSIKMAHHCFNGVGGDFNVVERSSIHCICYKSTGKKCSEKWSSERQGKSFIIVKSMTLRQDPFYTMLILEVQIEHFIVKWS